MRRIGFALLLGAAAAALAAPRSLPAQPVPDAPAGTTVLRLTETAEVPRAPDEVVAVLRAENRAASAAATQAAVNAAVTAALDRARAAAGVTASTGRYWTNRTDDPRGWAASQEVRLRAAEPAPLLELAGQLQERGLALSGLSFGLTADAARAAREEATTIAIDRLRRRAEAVARQLGLRVERLAELRVDAAEPSFRPQAAPMAMAARAAPPPAAQAEDAQVTASVEATAILRAP